MRLGAVLLAAGFSRRMGAANKLLLPVEGEPLVRRTARRVLAAGFADVVVVSGHQAEAIEAALSDLPLRVVRNPRPEDGQMTSTRIGLDALAAVEGVAIVLSDLVALTASDLRALQAAFRIRPRGEALVPFYRGRRGHPLFLTRRAVDIILSRGGRFGCKHFVRDHPDLAYVFEADSERVCIDLDRPEDYEGWGRG
ncbi:MAG: nucleotidyltransferase family protein [Myxococcota bacterium]